MHVQTSLSEHGYSTHAQNSFSELRNDPGTQSRKSWQATPFSGSTRNSTAMHFCNGTLSVVPQKTVDYNMWLLDRQEINTFTWGKHAISVRAASFKPNG